MRITIAEVIGSIAIILIAVAALKPDVLFGLWPILLISFMISFAISFRATPFLAYRLKLRGLVGKDINKLNRPEVAEMGGFGVLIAFIFSILVTIFLTTYFVQFKIIQLTPILAALITITTMGILGLLDDLIGWKKGLQQYQHALIPIFASFALMAFSVGNTKIFIPFLGLTDLGIIYPLILVPVAITGASNATNMLAGLNGLEAGLGIINTITLLIFALAFNRPEAAIILVGVLGALIAFFYFNKFPAKIFPGDALTLMIGSALATACIIGNMEKFGLFLFVMFFAEFIIKAKHKFQSECFGIPEHDGTLRPDPRGGSLTHIVMGWGKFTEGQVTLIFMGIQTIIAVTILLSRFVFHII